MTNNYPIKDGVGRPLTRASTDEGSFVMADRVDASGAPVTAAVLGSGGSGFLGWLTQIALNTASGGGGSFSGALTAGEAHIGEVAGKIAVAQATLTRPANTTAYTANTIVANNATAGSVVPITLAVARSNDKTVMIRRLRLKVNDTAWLNAVVRVHLYKDSPTFAVGDGGNWISGTTESTYIGYADIVLDRQFSDPFVKGFGVPAVGSEWNVEPSAGTQNIFAVLETRSAVTPGSAKTFTLAAECHQN